MSEGQDSGFDRIPTPSAGRHFKVYHLPTDFLEVPLGRADPTGFRRAVPNRHCPIEYVHNVQSLTRMAQDKAGLGGKSVNHEASVSKQNGGLLREIARRHSDVTTAI